MFNFLKRTPAVKLEAGGYYAVEYREYSFVAGPMHPDSSGRFCTPYGLYADNTKVLAPVAAPPVELKVGHWYKTRSGDIVGPLKLNFGNLAYKYPYVISMAHDTYSPTGRVLAGLDADEEGTDIVCEVPEPVKAPEEEATEDETDEEPYLELTTMPRPNIEIKLRNGQSLTITPASTWETEDDGKCFASILYSLNDAIARGDKVFWIPFKTTASFIVLSEVIQASIINMPEGFNYAYRPA